MCQVPSGRSLNLSGARQLMSLFMFLIFMLNKIVVNVPLNVSWCFRFLPWYTFSSGIEIFRWALYRSHKFGIVTTLLGTDVVIGTQLCDCMHVAQPSRCTDPKSD